MKIPTQHRYIMVLATSAVLLSGCGKKPDAITEAAKKDKKEGIAEPSIAEVKQIAQEGFMYGLPHVMGYTAKVPGPRRPSG